MELLAEYDVDLEGLKMAEELKSHVEKLYSNYWHVIIGWNFGCYSIHE